MFLALASSDLFLATHRVPTGCDRSTDINLSSESTQRPTAAASRSMQAHGINPPLAQPVGDTTLTWVELHIPTDPCPDCHGSGKYTGLNSIEDCRTCGGSGVRIW